MNLTSILKTNLNWNAARISFLANIITALLKTRTVCLTEIATALSGKAKTESKYKRLQRFFGSFSMDMDSISRMVANILPISNEKWVLSVDRTNWKLGKANINILCLGICYMGICFPIIWISLDKRGNSNTRERISLMERFIKIFGIAKIKCLTADREFIGFEWFSYLLEKGISFRIRIKENFQIISSKGNQVAIKLLFRNLKIGQIRVLSRPREICGVKVFIIGQKLPNGEYLILGNRSLPPLCFDSQNS
ncbi:MAG: IS4 family transposase [Desulfamplus sp.]|nr:IS4 family transposase [Desulfamplus sp.]